MSALKSPEEMTPEQLAITLKNIKILEVWIKAVHAHAFDLLKDGGKIPGFKLGYGVRRRIWRPGNEGAALKALKLIGLTEDELLTKPELISPAQTEKVLKLHGLWPKKPKGQADRPPTVIDPYVEKSMPELKVVPDDGSEDKASEAEKDFS
jgi:hypothetical protein